MIGLAKEGVEIARIVDLCRVLETGIHPATALDTVVSGEFVDREQIAVAEDDALRVFVREFSDLGFVRAQNELRDRFNGLRAPRLHIDERITILDPHIGHGAGDLAVAGIDVIGDARLILDIELCDVATDSGKRRDHHAAIRDKSAPPIHFGG